MGLLDRAQALHLAEGLVEASSAEETEVVIESEAGCFVRFAESGPTQSADRERHRVSIRVRLRGDGGAREGAATCDGLDSALMLGTLERAVELARHAPEDDALVPLGGTVTVEPREPDVATLEHGFAPKAEWVREAQAACRAAGLVPAGLAETGGESRTVVNSAGRAVHAARSKAYFGLTAAAADLRGGSGFADTRAARVLDLDVSGVVRRAVDKGARNQDPKAVDPGEYAVVLEPHAVSALLLFAGYKGFSAQDVAEQQSFLCGRMGERCFSERLTVVDDASNPVYPGLPLDGEGSPKRRVVLIEEGVARGVLTDTTWAARLRAPNTGHALRQPDPSGPRPRDLCVEPGDASFDELVAGVERGLLVTQFHYANMIDPLELRLTGMTRNGTFLIEGGEVTRPVRNLRFTDSLLRAWSRIGAVGRDRAVAGALFEGQVVTPALRVDGLRFTSGTDF